MPKPKPSTISRDPYATPDPFDFLGTPAKKDEQGGTPDKAATAPKPAVPPARKIETVKITHIMPVDLIERARDAAYWERATLTGIITQALTEALDHMEAKRGEAYPPRESNLRGGRPIGSGKTRNA